MPKFSLAWLIAAALPAMLSPAAVAAAPEPAATARLRLVMQSKFFEGSASGRPSGTCSGARNALGSFGVLTKAEPPIGMLVADRFAAGLTVERTIPAGLPYSVSAQWKAAYLTCNVGVRFVPQPGVDYQIGMGFNQDKCLLVPAKMVQDADGVTRAEILTEVERDLCPGDRYHG